MTVAEAVTVLPFSPKDTLLELEKTKADKLFDVVPADKLTLDINPAVEGTVYDAVIWVDPDIPNEIPLEFEKTTVFVVAV